MAVHPDTVEIMAWAKRSSRAQSRDVLTCDDVMIGVYACRETESVASAVRDAVGGSPTWPEALEALREAAAAVEPIEDPIPVGEDLQPVIQAAHGKAADLAPAVLLGQLLQHREGLPGAFHAANQGGLLVSGLEARLSEAQALMEAAAREVEGQEAAIAMLGDAYLRASLGASPSGPRGIFTFLGPPGVGKTLLAETFARHLAQSTFSPYVFRRFDMSMFAGHQNHEQLFGMEAFYRDSRAGTLTGFVHANPRTVILFDEIEKAHDNVIQSLLAVLDKGEVVDKHLDQPVDFSQTWLVFTSNLGREFFDDSDRSGFLHTLDHAPGMVFEILGSAKRRGAEEATVPALAPEFVSRLAKGGAVVFRRLETRHHLTLLERAVQRQVASGRERSGIDLPEVTLTRDVLLLFLLSLLPAIDARKVVSRGEAWSIDVIGRAYRALRDELQTQPTDTLTIAVEPGDDAKAFLEERRPTEIRLLLIDEDTYLPPVLETLEPGVKVRRIWRDSEVAEAVRRFDPDLVLLDLTLGVPLGSAEVEPALRILEELRSTSAHLPVFLFSENPEDRESFDRVLRAVMDRGGARGFVPCNRRPERPSDLDDFRSRIGSIIEELATAKLLDKERRSHRTVSWDVSYQYDADESVIHAEVGPPRSLVAYSAADPASPIQFRGIPGARFSDVVGLSRAKRRLAGVLDGLKDPAKLAAFGTAPPRGLLLAGPPGTGKTLLARALAGEAGLPFLALSAGELKSKWVGESEARIRELFARARQYAPAIVFIDEIDGIAARRGPSSNSHDTSALNQLLAELDGAGPRAQLGLVLAATNHPEALDPALVRPGRFDEVIPMDLPNLNARKEFFETRLGTLPTEGDIDLERLAKAAGGASPAELDRMVREAVYHAAGEDRVAITEADLHFARRLVRFGAEAEDTIVDADDRRMTAYHEAGHALCFLLRFPDRTIDHLTIVPNERGALGYLAPQHEEGVYAMSADHVRRELVVALGGREAERLIGGEHAMTTGVSSDLAHATNLAWNSITRWGFDPKIGPLGVDALPPEARAKWSDAVAERVWVWLKEAEEAAATDLREHRAKLDRLAETLLEQQSLDWDDLTALELTPPRH